MKRIDRTAPYCARPRSRLDLVPPCLGVLGHGGDGACFVHLPRCPPARSRRRPLPRPVARVRKNVTHPMLLLDIQLSTEGHYRFFARGVRRAESPERESVFHGGSTDDTWTQLDTHTRARSRQRHGPRASGSATPTAITHRRSRAPGRGVFGTGRHSHRDTHAQTHTESHMSLTVTFSVLFVRSRGVSRSIPVTRRGDVLCCTPSTSRNMVRAAQASPDSVGFG
jgi:hypothetical protein